MALPATDSFTNSSGSSQALNIYSANWTLERGTFIVHDGTDDCRSTGSGITCLGRWSADTFDANQRIVARISATPSGSYPGIAGRIAAGAATGYYLLVSDDYWEIGRINAGTETILDSGSGTIAASDIIMLEIETIDANTVRLRYYRAAAASPSVFTLRATVNDTSGSRLTAAGYAGVSGYGDNGSTVGVDDFVAGNLAGNPIALAAAGAAVAGATGAITTGIRLGAAAQALSAAVANMNAALRAAASAQTSAAGNFGGAQLAALANAQANAQAALTGLGATLAGGGQAQATASGTMNDRIFRFQCVRQDMSLLANQTDLWFAWFPSIAALIAAAAAAGGASGTGRSTDSVGMFSAAAPNLLSVGEDQGFGIVGNQDATADDAEYAYAGSFDVT